MIKQKLTVLCVLLLSTGCATQGATPHSSHRLAAHKSAVAQPQQQGQAAFAAIAELVEILRADPQTDWSKVSIDALRAHLLDMQQVTLQSVVEREPSAAGGLRFSVSGEGRVIEALQRMVPAHAGVVADTLPWRIATQLTRNGVVLEIDSDDPLEREKIAALGFYGFMAIGAHHQAHHQAIARGGAVHTH